jgi:hypothetical protein
MVFADDGRVGKVRGTVLRGKVMVRPKGHEVDDNQGEKEEILTIGQPHLRSLEHWLD